MRSFLKKFGKRNEKQRKKMYLLPSYPRGFFLARFMTSLRRIFVCFHYRIPSKPPLNEIYWQATRPYKKQNLYPLQLSEAETKFGMAQLDIKSLERKLQLGIEDNNKLKIEVERFENQTSKLKSSNFELNQNIEAAMEKCDELTCERAALAEQLDLMEASHAEERLKLEATNSQQTKLIDFLQCKAEGQASKKKKVKFSRNSWCILIEMISNVSSVSPSSEQLKNCIKRSMKAIHASTRFVSNLSETRLFSFIN